jgi:diguanylate cyclase (GGDEF)-like protein
LGSKAYSRLWYSAIGALVLAQVVASALLPRGSVLTYTTDIIDASLIALALLAATFSAIRGHSRLRLFWMLQSCSFALSLVAQALWMGYELILKKEAPNPFIGDIFLFLSEVPMVAGFLLQPHLEERGERVRVGIVDFLLLLLWWLYLFLFFVIPWQFVSLNEANYGANFNLLDAVQGFVTIVILAALWTRSQGSWKVFYGLFCLAEICSSIFDHIINTGLDAHTYYPGSWPDIGFAVSVGFFASLVVRGSNLVPEPKARPAEGRWVRIATLAVPAVLSLPLMAAWILVDQNTPIKVRSFRLFITLATIFVMVLLAFVRQMQLGRALSRMNSILQEASITDPLTGSRNRRFFDETIASDVDHVLRAYGDEHDEDTRDLVFYLIDADNFKEVNDWFGHTTGDKVLVEMARRISTAIRNSDVLVRWGGEEFLVVSRYTNRADAEILASRVLYAVGDTPFSIDGIEEPIVQKCSVGWAAFPFIPQQPEAVSYEEVLSLADRALYVAKGQGRNRAVGMSPGKESWNAIPGVHRISARAPGTVEARHTLGPGIAHA